MNLLNMMIAGKFKAKSLNNRAFRVIFIVDVQPGKFVCLHGSEM